MDKRVKIIPKKKFIIKLQQVESKQKWNYNFFFLLINVVFVIQQLFIYHKFTTSKEKNVIYALTNSVQTKYDRKYYLRAVVSLKDIEM